MSGLKNTTLSCWECDCENIAKGLREFSHSTQRPSNDHPSQWAGMHQGKVSARANNLSSLMEEMKRQGIPHGDTIVRHVEKTSGH
ncbi:MAG: hypothetical protein OXC66_07630 [Roseovarius sp.]|nr:hypothetical protein [Roseovarius sp.]